jgi:NAD-dependent deacetylase
MIKANKIVFFTGAGMSAESGIDTFRGNRGFWTGVIGRVGLSIFGTSFGWNWIPKISWNVYLSYFYSQIDKAKPNDGHEAIGELSKNGNFNPSKIQVITQNVDELHQQGGVDKEHVYEIHGSCKKYRCITKGHPFIFDDNTNILNTPQQICKVEGCNSYIRPDATLFNEDEPPDIWSKAENVLDSLNKDDVFIIIGTSASVFPAASLPTKARDRGAMMVEINILETDFSKFSLLLKERAGRILPFMVSLITILSKNVKKNDQLKNEDILTNKDIKENDEIDILEN